MKSLRYHIEQLVTLDEQTYNDICELINTGNERCQYNSICYEKIESIINNKNKKLFVVKAKINDIDDYRIRGFALFTFSQTICLNKSVISDFIISSNFKGFGILKKIYEKCLEEAKKLNVDLVELLVNKNNITAISLYKSFGLKSSEYEHMNLILTKWGT